jgi:hypothetical protein
LYRYVLVDMQLLTERQQREKDLQERRGQVRARQEMNAKLQHRWDYASCMNPDDGTHSMKKAPGFNP